MVPLLPQFPVILDSRFSQQLHRTRYLAGPWRCFDHYIECVINSRLGWRPLREVQPVALGRPCIATPQAAPASFSARPRRLEGLSAENFGVFLRLHCWSLATLDCGLLSRDSP